MLFVSTAGRIKKVEKQYCEIKKRFKAEMSSYFLQKESLKNYFQRDLWLL